jgi:hypothetical protein
MNHEGTTLPSAGGRVIPCAPRLVMITTARAERRALPFRDFAKP